MLQMFTEVLSRNHPLLKSYGLEEQIFHVNVRLLPLHAIVARLDDLMQRHTWSGCQFDIKRATLNPKPT